MRELLQKHGSFAALEVELSKKSSQVTQNERAGGWENEVTLAQLGWTEWLGWQWLVSTLGAMPCIADALLYSKCKDYDWECQAMGTSSWSDTGQ